MPPVKVRACGFVGSMADFTLKSVIFHARGLNVVFPVSRVLGGSGDKMAELLMNSAIPSE